MCLIWNDFGGGTFGITAKNSLSAFSVCVHASLCQQEVASLPLAGLVLVGGSFCKMLGGDEVALSPVSCATRRQMCLPYLQSLAGPPLGLGGSLLPVQIWFRR